MNSVDILDRLIGFATVSLRSNRDLIAYIQSVLGLSLIHI